MPATYILGCQIEGCVNRVTIWYPYLSAKDKNELANFNKH